MSSINNHAELAKTPSSPAIAMSAFGHSGRFVAQGFVRTLVIADDAVRTSVRIEGGEALAMAYNPGTRAWRPPMS